MIWMLLAQAAAAQAAPAAPVGPAWELVYEAPGGRLFVDPAAIRRDGDSVVFTTFAVRFDCAARTLTVFSERFFGATGNVVRVNEIDEAERRAQPIRRASPANAAFYRRLCGAELDGGQG